MSATAHSLTLPAREFAGAFPFHFAFDRDQRLIQFGAKLTTICPGARTGRVVDGLFRILRPDSVTGWRGVAGHLETLFLVESHETGVKLRGQVLALDNGETMLFLGSPWFTDSQDVVAAGLSFGDFAIHDSGLDMMLALQAQKMGYEEVRALASELSSQRAELRGANTELEARNQALRAAKDALLRSGEELRMGARRMETLVRSLQDGIIVEDNQHKVVLVNELFCRLFGIGASAGELEGADCREAGVQAAGLFVDRAKFVPRIEEIVREQKIVLGEELGLVNGRVYRRDYMPVMDAATCVGHMWAYRDITPQKKAERELRAERNLLAITLSSMSEGVITVDQEQRVKLMNTAAMDLTGWRLEQAAGKAVQEVMVLTTTANEPVPCPVAKAFFGSERVGDLHVLENSVTLRSHSGGAHTVVIRCSPFFSPEGGVTGGVVILRDVTEEVQVENMKRSFVDTVSHELKTPLTAIQGFVCNLQRDADMPASTRQEFLTILGEQTLRLAALVEDILDVSRIESGEGSFRDERLQIVEVSRNSINAVRQQAATKGITLAFSPPESLPELLADRTRLESVVTNLLTNAIKFTPNGGKVALRLDYNGQEILIAVEDSGVGIPKEHHTRIFRKFYRIERSERTAPGTGLGLTIVRGIVTHYGGRVEVDSQEGEGTCFRVYLPVSSVKEAQQ